MACREKYKPCILKYKALILKYVPYIFRHSKHLINSNLQKLFNLLQIPGFQQFAEKRSFYGIFAGLCRRHKKLFSTQREDYARPHNF